MLKYIKRQTSRRLSSSSSHDADADVVDTAAGGGEVGQQKRHSLRSTTSFCDDILMEEEQLHQQQQEGEADGLSLLTVEGADEDTFKYNSRLSMTLSAIVSEPNCLSYFIQYLDSHQALPLIKFYLDIENFKRAALMQMDKREEKDIEGDVEAEEKLPEVREEQNDGDLDLDLDVDDNVPELKTLCDLSMRKPLTDDEKSLIYAETNKQLNKKQKLSLASINDALAIYQKYLINHLVELPIVILAHISLLLCGKDKSSSSQSTARPILASCFDEARDYVLRQLERDHLRGFLLSSYYSKYCLELLDDEKGEKENLSINIYDVLYSELALFYFTEFLEQHQEREGLEFWIMAINFRKSYNDNDEENNNASEAKSDAMIIYEKYFSLQSPSQLWCSKRLRSHVEQAICSELHLAQAFDLPLRVIAKYLEQKYFQDFLKSNIFDNYLNELRAKSVVKLSDIESSSSTGSATLSSSTNLQHKLSLRRNPKVNAQQRHRKTLSMSDCTHISQHNTLLASMDNTKNHVSHLNIDSRQLTNPQLLWERPRGALKFGHVNSLGRYERDFEGVDSSMTNLKSQQPWSQLKSAVRKLVNLPEEKVQEEIAWQVAEMIVKDVTSVTLKGSKALV
ncbi:A-kinase anchor protein 10, mitochondrial [Drosophila willistoni]|uniref:A-kinase anchor protein 10, mitochondrial n=1 Tax=Drosophila willistoni TaxID=7260 RepID=UPI00017D7AF1|nr:A-kinase anchor protein 10, mitochondrial [Drosophila willistoni]